VGFSYNGNLVAFPYSGKLMQISYNGNLVGFFNNGNLVTFSNKGKLEKSIGFFHSTKLEFVLVESQLFHFFPFVFEYLILWNLNVKSHKV
jgi:hypothetical protein